MSPGPADQVNAKELSARAAVVERRLELAQLDRVTEAGGLPGTRIEAQLRFGTFDGRTTVDVHVDGVTMAACQRCLQPCATAVDESAEVMVVRDEDEVVPGGYEPFVGMPEHLSLTALIEEQVLLGDPQCRSSGADVVPLAPASGIEPAARAAAEEKQTPFANLRELLGDSDERDPRSGE
jgi:uncharacterized metal-binding protein YceD (DUF177 family)